MGKLTFVRYMEYPKLYNNFIPIKILMPFYKRRKHKSQIRMEPHKTPIIQTNLEWEESLKYHISWFQNTSQNNQNKWYQPKIRHIDQWGKNKKNKSCQIKQCTNVQLFFYKSDKKCTMKKEQFHPLMVWNTEKCK